MPLIKKILDTVGFPSLFFFLISRKPQNGYDKITEEGNHIADVPDGVRAFYFLDDTTLEKNQMGIERLGNYRSNTATQANQANLTILEKVSKSIKHGSTGSPKQVPKTASIECCARPPVPQVMKVCFTLVLGHRYETCTLVFYRGVFKKKNSCPKCTHAPLFYRENGVKKKPKFDQKTLPEEKVIGLLDRSNQST